MKKQVIFEKVDTALWTWYEFMNGTMGGRTLKPKYRKIWRWLTWGVFIILLFVFVFKPIMDWWEGMVNYINYVWWGIGKPI